MQELIKIEKQIIGAEELNAVNARDLHSGLEIKKQFTHWIDNQIQRAGLQENVDYVVSTISSNGGRPQKNYIITTDASKHIAMMSQGQKAKEVRDYFIQCEKELNSQEINLQVFMKNVSEALVEQSKAIIALTQTVENLVDPQRKVREQRMQSLQLIVIEKKKTENEALTTRERDSLREAVANRARELQRHHNLDTAKISQLIFSELNKKFGTKSYGHIRQGDYLEATMFVSSMLLFNF
ncbi:MAG: antA/AntB antirepressor family protein [Sulfurimonas sp.]|nr:antA/AntB antirepressor family protein [Sulfurimonas sp.]MDQ7067726.1 antA/AntB antirepressor family protein [Sulfurimonas sp.]